MDDTHNFRSTPDDVDDDEADLTDLSAETKPRILLMGLKRSGKSSIQKVVFHKMSPNDTLFLQSTTQITKDDISNGSFVQFQIWDFPGQIDFCDLTYDAESIFGVFGALIFVIDAQDEYIEALRVLNKTLTHAHKVNRDIKFEVFIHKVDGISDDNKIELQRDISQRASIELAEAGFGSELHLSYYLTSIYDHSIFEAFSKVVQKLIPQLPTLENLLNIFISNSGIEKAFLFDVVSKIYIATDSSPVEMQMYELCCDMIDVVLDVSCIYSENIDEENSGFDSDSSSTIRLNNETVLYLREVNQHLAVVCILREDNFERQVSKELHCFCGVFYSLFLSLIHSSAHSFPATSPTAFNDHPLEVGVGLIDYNFLCFRTAIKKVFDVCSKQPSLCADRTSEAAESVK